MPDDPWSDEVCPIARAMSVLGQRWAVLIVREALLGRSLFSEFRRELGVAPDVLSARLAALVEAGVLDAVEYQAPGARRRNRYVLTDAGHDLVPVLAAAAQWGHRHMARADSSPYRFVESSTGRVVSLGMRRRDGTTVPTADVDLVDAGTSRP